MQMPPHTQNQTAHSRATHSITFRDYLADNSTAQTCKNLIHILTPTFLIGKVSLNQRMTLVLKNEDHKVDNNIIFQSPLIGGLFFTLKRCVLRQHINNSRIVNKQITNISIAHTSTESVIW